MMAKFGALRPRKQNHLEDDNDGNKKAKVTKECAIKQKLKFDDYKYCLEVLLLNQLAKNKVESQGTDKKP